MDQSSSKESESTTRWWSKETVAIVTGGNKGIGFEIVKSMAEMGLTVILTARDFNRGSEALSSLFQHNSNTNLHFFCLDVSDPPSIHAFVSWFSLNFTALDILVNNAAVSFNEIGENSVENAEIVMKTNYFGAKLLTDSLMPFFRRSASTSRLLNITSRLGSLDKVSHPGVREILGSSKVTEQMIEEVVKWFMEDVKGGRWKSSGWPEQWTDYAVSKLALNAYTRVVADEYRGKGLSANCYCPGFTKTSMTGGQGTHSARDAAQVAATIALLPPQDLPTGHFFVWSSPSSSSSSSISIHSKL